MLQNFRSNIPLGRYSFNHWEKKRKFPNWEIFVRYGAIGPNRPPSLTVYFKSKNPVETSPQVDLRRGISASVFSVPLRGQRAEVVCLWRVSRAICSGNSSDLQPHSKGIFHCIFKIEAYY